MKITIDEKEYGLTWGIAAIDRFCTVVDLEIEPALDLLLNPRNGMKQTIATAKFISCAIDSNAIINSQPLPGLPYQKILMEIDKKGPSWLAEIGNDFKASQLMGQTVSEFLGLVEDEVNKTGKTPAKKKQVAPKS